MIMKLTEMNLKPEIRDSNIKQKMNIIKKKLIKNFEKNIVKNINFLRMKFV